MGWRQKAWVKDEPCPKLLLRQKKGFLTRTEVFKTGLVEKYIHHVLHSDFLGQKSMFLMLTDDGKKLLLIFRGSFARSVPRNTSTAKCCRELRRRGSSSPSCPGHACAGSLQTNDVQSKFTSYSTACTVTPHFQQHCSETRLMKCKKPPTTRHTPNLYLEHIVI